MSKQIYLLSLLFASLIPLEAISIKLPVILEITIRDELGNIQVGFPVKLYENRTDYYDEDADKSVFQGKTDKKGKIIFRKKVKPKQYYIRAESKTKTNADKAIQTSVLQRGKINKITIIVHPI